MVRIIESKVNDKYINTYFRIYAGYEWGPGWIDADSSYAFFDEIIHLFEDNGFIVKEPRTSGGCPVAVKPGTSESLYLHPMELTGPVLESDIPKIERLLQDGETFKFLRTDTYGELYDLTDNEYLDYLESNKDEIEQDIINDIGNKFTYYDFFGNNKVYNKWHLPRTTAHIGKSSGDVDIQFFENVLQDLIDSGIVIKDKNGYKYKVVK